MSSIESWGPMSEWTLPRLLRRCLANFPEREFIQIDGGDWMSYRTVLEAGEVAARRLASLDVGPGDRVLVLSRLSPDLISVWFGANLLGAADVVLNPALRGHTLVHAMNLPRSQVLIVQEALLSEVERVLDQLPHLRHIVVIDTDGQVLSHSKRLEVHAFANIPETTVEWPDVPPSAVSSIIYTSGTTGPAKGVMNSQAQVYANAYLAVTGLRLTQSDTIYTFHPLFHMCRERSQVR